MRIHKAGVFLLVAGAAAAAVVATNQTTYSHNAVEFDSALVMSPQVRGLMSRSCADCHSMTSHLPWYSHIPPVSWLIEKDIKNARKAVNLTAWSKQNGKTAGAAIGTLAAMCADVQSGRMPDKNYLFMHPDAKLSRDDVSTFCAWTAEQMARTKPIRASRAALR